MTGIWKLLLIGVGLYAVISIYIYYMQSNLIYYPNMPGRDLAASPEDIGLAYEDVEFTSEDGVRLHGWFIPSRDTEATLLFFHGNAGNISHRLDSISLFNQLGLNVFIIDYRGYGRSEGKITERGSYRDAEAAWNYLVDDRGIDDERIIVFGRSLGASIAAWLASKHTPSALIIESGFSSVASMGHRIYPFLPIRLLTRFRYDTKQYVKSINCPVLIVHSKDDDIIPYEEGLEIFDAAPEPKQLLKIHGGHNDGFMVSGSRYLDGLRDFIGQK